MEIVYSLEKEDYLAYQLYHLSVSKKWKRKRFINRILVPVFYLAVGTALAMMLNTGYWFVFAVIAIAWYVLYPVYSRRMQKRAYDKIIEVRMEDRFGKKIRNTLTENGILIKGPGGESLMGYENMEKIIETGSHYMISLLSGGAMVIPKTEIEGLISFITQLKEKANLQLEEQLDWKWGA